MSRNTIIIFIGIVCFIGLGIVINIFDDNVEKNTQSPIINYEKEHESKTLVSNNKQIIKEEQVFNHFNDIDDQNNQIEQTKSASKEIESAHEIEDTNSINLASYNSDSDWRNYKKDELFTYMYKKIETFPDTSLDDITCEENSCIVKYTAFDRAQELTSSFIVEYEEAFSDAIDLESMKASASGFQVAIKISKK